MWESVGTSKEWVESRLPEVVRKWAFNPQNISEHNVDIQGMRCGEGRVWGREWRGGEVEM